MATDIAERDSGMPTLLTVPQLAAYLGVPVSTIYYWRGRNEGPPALKAGKRLLFRASEVIGWLEAQTDSQPAA